MREEGSDDPLYINCALVETIHDLSYIHFQYKKI